MARDTAMMVDRSLSDPETVSDLEDSQMAWLRRTEGGSFSISFRIGAETYQRSLQTRDALEAEFLMAKVKLELRALKQGTGIGNFLTTLITNAHLSRSDFDAIRANGMFSPDAARRSAEWKLEPGVDCEPSPQIPKAAPLSIAELFERYRQTKKSNIAMKYHVSHLVRLVKRPFAEVMAADLQNYADRRLLELHHRQPVKPQTVRKELLTFSTLWRWAAKRSMANGEPPTIDVVLPATEARELWRTLDQTEKHLAATPDLLAAQEGAVWSATWMLVDQVVEFLTAVKSRCDAEGFAAMVLAATTGARRSEISISELTDWDFDSKIIKIREHKRAHGEKHTWRMVPMAPMLVKAVEPIIAQRKSGLLIRPPETKTRSVDLLTRNWKTATKGTRFAKLPGWHCLRHSLRSNLEGADVSQVVVDAILGHDGRSAVKRTYSHREIGKLHEAINKLGLPSEI